MKTFPTIKVTQAAHDAFRDYEQAVMRLAAAAFPNEVADAYATLCQRRKEVYEHIQAAESLGTEPRTVVLRF